MFSMGAVINTTKCFREFGNSNLSTVLNEILPFCYKLKFVQSLSLICLFSNRVSRGLIRLLLLPIVSRSRFKVRGGSNQIAVFWLGR